MPPEKKDIIGTMANEVYIDELKKTIRRAIWYLEDNKPVKAYKELMDSL